MDVHLCLHLEISIFMLCWSCQWLSYQWSGELYQVVDSFKTNYREQSHLNCYYLEAAVFYHQHCYHLQILFYNKILFKTQIEKLIKI